MKKEKEGKGKVKYVSSSHLNKDHGGVGVRRATKPQRAAIWWQFPRRLLPPRRGVIKNPQAEGAALLLLLRHLRLLPARPCEAEVPSLLQTDAGKVDQTARETEPPHPHVIVARYV